MNPPLCPPDKCPKLADLADHCLNGACNSGALILALAVAIEPLSFVERRDHPAVKIVLGQLAYLSGESLGPREETIEAYRGWRVINSRDALT